MTLHFVGSSPPVPSTPAIAFSTWAGEIEFRHFKPIGHGSRSQQGEQGKFDESKTLVVLLTPAGCSKPRGLSYPPQIVTEGVPTATAMCIGPETGPT
jgi:hypothetical protein